MLCGSSLEEYYPNDLRLSRSNCSQFTVLNLHQTVGGRIYRSWFALGKPFPYILDPNTRTSYYTLQGLLEGESDLNFFTISEKSKAVGLLLQTPGLSWRRS